MTAEKRKEDERLNNYLTDNNLSSYRKLSPSSPSQASFLDTVHSSYGSSPMDHTTNSPMYFPMSPGNNCNVQNDSLPSSIENSVFFPPKTV